MTKSTEIKIRKAYSKLLSHLGWVIAAMFVLPCMVVSAFMMFLVQDWTSLLWIVSLIGYVGLLCWCLVIVLSAMAFIYALGAKIVSVVSDMRNQAVWKNERRIHQLETK